METRAGPKTALNYFQPALWTRCRDIQHNMTEKDNWGGNGGMRESFKEGLRGRKGGKGERENGKLNKDV